MAMRRYGRDDYEDLDEYEDEGEEQEEEGVDEEEYEVEEEAPQPTQEELEYLELRQRLKESIRKQMKKESGSVLTTTQEKKKKMPYDNYGSFFGPSQPVIAQRVIQESKSLLENQHLAAKVSKSPNDKNRNFASTKAGSKTQVRDSRPKVVNEVKMKVQKLKDTRDYSFLLSDDAELPAPTKDRPPRNVSVPNSEARSAQVPPNSKQSLTHTVRQVPIGREERKPVSTGTHTVRQVPNGRDERKPMSTGTHTVRQVPNGREGRKPVSTGSQMHAKSGSHKLTAASKPILTSVESRRQLGNHNGSGPGRPLGPKGLPSKMPATTTERRVPVAVAKMSLHSVQKPPSSKLHSSASKQPSVLKQHRDQRKEFQESGKGKMLPKQPVPSYKPQINKPPAKSLSRPAMQEDRPKKKPVRRYSDEDDEYDGGNVSSMIRKMFGYNPNKYSGWDDDDSDMEANFDDILREEKRSARIAREEDEEELRKLEEEERQERLRKVAKKRKLSQR